MTELHHLTFHAMGSPCSLHLYCDAGERADLSKALMGEVQRLESKYSRYLENSVAANINRAAQQGGSITLDQETAALLDYAQTAWEESDGYFDITSGILRRAWNFKSGRLPQQSVIDSLLPFIGWHKLTWQNPVLSFPTAGMEIDFGGYVKEYAADCVAALARNLGVGQGLVELGGDIRVIGPHPGNRPWAVGIRHPRKPDCVMATIQLNAGAIASSGDYERCIMVNGRRYGHVLSPFTGWPMAGLISVTVQAEHCLLAGSAATLALLKERQGIEWLERQSFPWLAMKEEGELAGTISSF